MKLLVIIIMAACMMLTTVRAKPIFSLKVVEVPVAVPQVNIIGAVGKVLGIKAALIGQTLKAKANILQKIANIKGGLGTLLTSSVPQVVVKKPTLSLSPSSTYGAPSPPAVISQKYGAPYPA